MASRLLKAILLGGTIGAAGVAGSLLPWAIDLEEGVGLPLLFRLRGPAGPPPDVVIVSVDKASADRLKLPDDLRRWPRSLHARLVEALVGQGASVIAFDIYFEEPRDRSADRALAEAIAKAGKVVVCERLRADWVSPARAGGAGAREFRVLTQIPALPAVEAAAAALAPFPLAKVPLVVSKTWTFTLGAAGETPTLPVAAFQLHALPLWKEFVRLAEKSGSAGAAAWPRTGEEVLYRGRFPALAREIREMFRADPGLADRMRRELEKGSSPGAESEKRILRSLIALYDGPAVVYLNFYGPARTIATVPYSEVLSSPGRDGRAAKAVDLRGKAVFVGSSESSQTDQKDGFPTVFTDARGLDLSGVEIAATAFANFLEERPVRPLRLLPHVAVVFLWGLAAGGLCLLLTPARAGAAVLALSGGYAFLALGRFSAAGTWLPVAIPLFFQAPVAWSAALVWSYLETSRDRKSFRTALLQYLPTDAVDRIAREIADPARPRRVVHGVCLATDAERYTALAETMDPRELGVLMNRYYEAVIGPVRTHGGTVSNVVGDAMLALWVASSADESPAPRAGAAAVDIARALNAVAPRDADTCLPTRIGLHSGPIFLGALGGADHYEYRPLGDIVNTATRIEGLNRRLGTRILASEEVASRLDALATREVGTFLFAGKSRAVRVFEVMDRDAGAERLRIAGPAFSAGLGSFRRGEWEGAERSFRAVLGAVGEDGPSRFYIGLCARYRTDPPAPDWRGVVRVDKG